MNREEIMVHICGLGLLNEEVELIEAILCGERGDQIMAMLMLTEWIDAEEDEEDERWRQCPLCDSGCFSCNQTGRVPA